MAEYDPDLDARLSYDVAIGAMRRKHLGVREERIGDAVLYLGDCLEIMPTLGTVDHVLCDPPYEDELHEAIGRIRRSDGREMITDLGFAGINKDRAEVASRLVSISDGWLIVFSLAEGVRAWRDEIQVAKGKWDTCLAWVKPDASPRFNGQGTARGFECAITAWCGKGYRKWNGGGKRGVTSRSPASASAKPTPSPTSSFPHPRQRRTACYDQIRHPTSPPLLHRSDSPACVELSHDAADSGGNGKLPRSLRCSVHRLSVPEADGGGAGSACRANRVRADCRSGELDETDTEGRCVMSSHDDVVIDLHRAGMTGVMIAKTLGKSETWVYTRLKGHGVRQYRAKGSSTETKRRKCLRCRQLFHAEKWMFLCGGCKKGGS